MTGRPSVDNSIYGGLGERWYCAHDDPVALLRAEARARNPWVLATLRGRLGEKPARVLDLGCGAGFLSNALAAAGHEVTGLDASEEALGVARAHDATGRARYLAGDAHAPPFAAGAFDAACAMDFLEHVEKPARVIQEAARVLRPGGLFFFHTFNRNLLSALVVIRGVEWFVRNTPRNLHVLRLFLKPAELRGMLEGAGLGVAELRGLRPVVDAAFFKMLATRVVPENFRFRFTRSLVTGYTGFAVKRLENQAGNG